MLSDSESKSASFNGNFIVGDWTVEPNTGYLSNGEDKIKLEPRVMSLLVCLAEKDGEVISREELEAKVWQGSVVGYDALTSAMIKLRKAFHDNSKHPTVIETVSKRGYRLIAKVSHEKNEVASIENHPTPLEIEKSNNLIFRIEFWMGLFFIALGLSFFLFNWNATFSSVKSESKNIPAILVLPFVNMSGKTEQDYFTDGITENVITDLSHLSALRVMARNTSFRLKNQTIDPIKIGKELEIAYLLQGSVQKSSNNIRISAQLIDTSNGYQVWAEKYDRKLIEIFEVQDDVTQQIVKALAVNLTTQEKAALDHSPTNNLEAYDQFMLGQRLYTERTKEANTRAKDAYRKSIQLDENYPRPYGGLAVAKIRGVNANWSDSPQADLDRALELAVKATSLKNSAQHAYWALGFVHLYRREYLQAIKAVEQSIKIAPSYADGYGLLSLIENTLGNGEKALELINKGVSLNPYYTYDYPYNIGRAYYAMGQYELAEKYLLQALERNENAVPPRLFLSASYLELGRQEDAEWEVEQVMNINNKISIKHLKDYGLVANNGKQKSLYDKLRKIGVPE